MLRRIILVISLVVSFANCEVKNFSQKEVAEWLTYYYVNPQPELTLDMIKSMSKQGILSRKKSLPVLSSFFSEIFKSNLEKVEDWIMRLSHYNGQERKVFMIALYYSDIDDKYKFINKLVKTENGKRLLKKMKSLKFVRIVDMKGVSPAILDQHWAAFFASGDERHIEKVLEVLPYSKPKNKSINLTGMSAKWSLTSNAVNHPRVLKFCRKKLKMVQGDIKEILNEVILAAEKKLKEKPSKLQK